MSSISVYESDLQWAAQQGFISVDQAQILWTQLVDRANQRWKLRWIHLLYFLGAFLIIGSMTWFTNLAWEDSKGLSLFWLALVYVFSFSVAGNWIWNQQKNLPQIVGGIFATIAVCIVPVSIFALQRYFNYWEKDTPGLYQALSVILAGAVMIYFIPFPFLTAPICLALYYLSEIDIALLIFTKPTFEEVAWVSVIFGLIMLAVFYFIDQLQLKEDFAFWGYIFGMLAFWGGLTGLYYQIYYNITLYKVFYFLINLGLMILSIPLNRNVFIVFGGAGDIYVFVDFFYNYATLEADAWTSILIGSFFIVLAYYKSKDPNSDFSFYAYIVGCMVFSSGWTTLYLEVYPSLFFKFIFFFVHCGLLYIGYLTQQKVFFFFGLLGMFGFITDLAYIYLSNSWALPFVLTLIGLIFIAIAIYFSKNALKKKKNEIQSAAPYIMMNSISADPSQLPFTVIYFPYGKE